MLWSRWSGTRGLFRFVSLFLRHLMMDIICCTVSFTESISASLRQWMTSGWDSVNDETGMLNKKSHSCSSSMWLIKTFPNVCEDKWQWYRTSKMAPTRLPPALCLLSMPAACFELFNRILGMRPPLWSRVSRRRFHLQQGCDKSSFNWPWAVSPPTDGGLRREG